MPDDELASSFAGYGYEPYFVEGDDPAAMHQAMAADLDKVIDGYRIDPDRRRGMRQRHLERSPHWPMIILRSPKGWTGPKEVDGHKVEGFWRAHQVPIAESARESRPPAPARGLDAQLSAGRAV